MDINHLFQLPEVVRTDILMNWTETNEFINFDSACCNRIIRPSVEDLISSQFFKNKLDGLYGGVEMLNWCQMRLVAPQTLCFTFTASCQFLIVENFMDLLVTVTTLRIKNCPIDVLSSEKLEDILDHCELLVSLDIHNVEAFDDDFVTTCIDQDVLSHYNRFSHTSWSSQSISNITIDFLVLNCFDLRELHFMGTYENLDLSCLIEQNLLLTNIFTSESIRVCVKSFRDVLNCKHIESVVFEQYYNNATVDQAVLILLVGTIKNLRLCALNKTAFRWESNVALGLFSMTVDTFAYAEQVDNRSVLTSKVWHDIIANTLYNITHLKLGDLTTMEVTTEDMTHMQSVLKNCAELNRLELTLGASDFKTLLSGYNRVEFLTIRRLLPLDVLISVLMEKASIKYFKLIEETDNIAGLKWMFQELYVKERLVYAHNGSKIVNSFK
jgi:hypothetical protein